MIKPNRKDYSNVDTNRYINDLELYINFLESKTSNEKIKIMFEELIGEENVQYIMDNNWIQFNQKHASIFNVNGILIDFLEVDHSDDVVNHQSILYDTDNKLWVSENCIDNQEIGFESYQEMKLHINSIENQITDNGFRNVDLPNIN